MTASQTFVRYYLYIPATMTIRPSARSRVFTRQTGTAIATSGWVEVGLREASLLGSVG